MPTFKFSLRENCPYLELFWAVFSYTRTEYGQIRSISPYLVRMRENTDQNYSEYGHFLHNVSQTRNLNLGRLILESYP